MTTRIRIACLDMAGTTVADEGSVLAAFTAAMERFGLRPGAPGYEQANRIVAETMGQSKIEVFRHILGDQDAAQEANAVFEKHYAGAVAAGEISPMPGAVELFAACRAAGTRVSRPSRSSATSLAPSDSNARSAAPARRFARASR